MAELCRRVATTVEEAFAEEVWVEGAISGLSRSANGHVYFDLIDPVEGQGRRAEAVLPVALFASQRKLVNRVLKRVGGIRMSDGIEIRIRGRVTYYPPQGRIQLVMSLIDPQYTLGQMMEARQRLLEALSRERLLDANATLPLSPLPLRIGLITSDQSAAYHDFVNEITACRYPFAITLIDTRVQGTDAAAGITAALGIAAGIDGLDVAVLVRGGGARSDLIAFDDEKVARAIATSPLPVVVGVGHETDRSVADEVAHTTIKTPTAAARFLIDTVEGFDTRTAQVADRLGALARRHIEVSRHRLVGNAGRLVVSARRVTDRQDLVLDQALDRLARVPALTVERHRQRLGTNEARLSAMDPARALARGWTITYGPDGRPVRSADQVAPGDRLRTLTGAGEVQSTVEQSDG